MGRMTSHHILWKIKNVPNHQPVLISSRTLAFDFAGHPLDSIKHVGIRNSGSLGLQIWRNPLWNRKTLGTSTLGSRFKYRFISTWRIVPRIGNCLYRDRLVIGFVPFSWVNWRSLVIGTLQLTGFGLDTPMTKKHWAITRPKKTIKINKPINFIGFSMGDELVFIGIKVIHYGY